MSILKENIALLIYQYENPSRIALSKRIPILRMPLVKAHRIIRHIDNLTNSDMRLRHSEELFPLLIAKHQSVLRRRLGDSDPQLQEKKIINLQQAIKRINGIVIDPNRIFSFWAVIGKPKYKNGYVDGMLISDGKIYEGIGGGLCQLSNLLYWIFLHLPVEILERHHHSRDVFPDSGRILPFGSGSTIFYNYIDLKVRNISNSPMQLNITLTDKLLKGAVLSNKKLNEKYHIYEKNHCFVKRNGNYFRYNEIYRDMLIEGKVMQTNLITINFAPVVYEVSEEYLSKHKFPVIEF